MSCLAEEEHSENEQVCAFLATKLGELRHRIFVLDVPGSAKARTRDKQEQRQRLTTSHMSEHEAQAVNAVIAALEELIPRQHILSLASYKLHAHLLKHGSSVQGAQGASRNVVLYSVCAYGSTKLSINGHIMNTAATRARSLFIVVADVQRLRDNFPGKKNCAGVRPEDISALKNLTQKVMPVQHFIDALLRKDMHAINAHFDEQVLATGSSYWAKKRKS